MTDRHRRGLAIVQTIQEMQEILSQRDKHETLGKMLKELAPEQYMQIESENNVPKWYMSLVLTLTKLYDQGYNDATKDSEQLK